MTLLSEAGFVQSTIAEALPAYRESASQVTGRAAGPIHDELTETTSDSFAAARKLLYRHGARFLGWVAMAVGLVLALLALIPAFVSQALTEKQYELDKWQALKEFVEYCNSEREGGRNPKNCQAATAVDLSLPPGIVLDSRFEDLVPRSSETVLGRLSTIRNSLVRPKSQSQIMAALIASFCLWAVGLYMLIRAQRRRRPAQREPAAQMTIELRKTKNRQSVFSIKRPRLRKVVEEQDHRATRAEAQDNEHSPVLWLYSPSLLGNEYTEDASQEEEEPSTLGSFPGWFTRQRQSWTSQDEQTLRQQEHQEHQILQNLRSSSSQGSSDLANDIRSLQDRLEETRWVRPYSAPSKPYYEKVGEEGDKTARRRLIYNYGGGRRKRTEVDTSLEDLSSQLEDGMAFLLEGTLVLSNPSFDKAAGVPNIDHDKVSDLLSQWLDGQDTSMLVGGEPPSIADGLTRRKVRLRAKRGRY
ncbi:hypothetical protein NLU13_5202 [Sarocladium strictum]|uniref:Transmembrane protein n=1 Tax=Sarocladium strictum TaxID=5046 RepID=A0AA39GI13_SARSR|nr:hypothetical protein NLU13_5202 [Sarocladium strictum]